VVTLNVTLAILLHYVTKIGSFGGQLQYIKVVEAIPILAATEM